MAHALASGRTRAFTLTELLIVVAIIAILAGLLMPALTLIKTQANTVKCSSNMRQIAMAIEVYRQNADNTFVGNFNQLVTQYALPPKVLLCPLDPTHGTDPNMGRAPANDNTHWGDYTRLYFNQIGTLANPAQPGPTSYDYECSGWLANPYNISANPLVLSGDVSFFYADLPTTQQPDPATVSWADCKQHEQALGNCDANGVLGQPFPPSAVPILRCYHHWDWPTEAIKDGDGNAYPSKVNNISLEFNQMWTTPYWETQYNPLLANATGH